MLNVITGLINHCNNYSGITNIKLDWIVHLYFLNEKHIFKISEEEVILGGIKTVVLKTYQLLKIQLLITVLQVIKVKQNFLKSMETYNLSHMFSN